MTNTITSIPYPTLRRYPLYIQVIENLLEQDKTHVSSSYIAKILGKEAIQVRKDLAYSKIVGQPRIGFPLKDLKEKIYDMLGWNNTHDAFLVGAGNLGVALSGYSKFEDYGLNILALFDTQEDKIGTKAHGKEIFHINKIADLVARFHVNIGILAVPGDVAQEVTDIMIDAGINCIWSFSNRKLIVPENVIVEQVNLAASLAVLHNKMKRRAGNNNGS